MPRFLQPERNILNHIVYVLDQLHLQLSHSKYFGYFHGVMTQFEIVKHKFSIETTFHVNLCSFQITHEVKQCTTWQRDTNNLIGYYAPKTSLSFFSSIDQAYTYELNNDTLLRTHKYRGCFRGVIKAMNWGVIVSEFELQSRYNVHFRSNTLGKGVNPLILPAMGWIVPLLSF